MVRGKANLGRGGPDSPSSPRIAASPSNLLDAGRLAPRSRSIVLPLLLFFTILAPIPGAFTWYLMQHREDALIGARFDEYIGAKAYSVKEKMLAIGENLYSLRSHFHASDEVTRAEFSTFTRETRKRFGAIQSLGWAVHVPASERDAHEARARAEGFTEYEIRGLSADGDLVRAPPAPSYCPVLFVEPQQGNEATLGLDLCSETARRQALMAASSADAVRFSDPIDLVQDRNEGRAIMAVVPILDPSDTAPGTIGGAPHGFASIVLPITDLIDWALPRKSDGSPEQMDFRMVHDAHQGQDPVLYSRISSPKSEPAEPWMRSVSIQVGGQRWNLEGRPTESFRALSRDSLPMTLGFCAAVAWVLLFGNLYIISRWSRGQELKKRDRIVRSVLGNLTEGVIVADGHGEIQLANNAAAAFLGTGCEGEDASKLSASLGCYKPDTVTRFAEAELPLNRAMRGEFIKEEQIYVRNKAVPSGRWLSVSGSPLRDTRRGLLGGVAVIRDITERKKSEEVLKRLSSAVEQTADVVFITNRGGTIEYVNPAFEATFGYEKNEVLGRTPRILRSGVHEREHYRKLWNTILAGQVFQSLTINRKKNGELIHTVQTITPMKDSHGRVTHFVSVCKDITERRRREEHEAELRVASLVQQRLFPEECLKMEGLDLAGAAFPAAATCGDYFDFFGFPEGGVALAIGDVCGHGLGAALLMAETRAYLRSLLRSRSKLPKAFEILNRSISDDVESGVFVTLLAAHLDRDKQNLVYASAGHVPGYIMDKSGEVRQELPPTGPALGILEDRHCKSSAVIPLNAGDLLLLLTDGVTETRAPDGSFFEATGALDLVRKHRHEPARAIVDSLYAGTRKFAETRPQRDDITMLVCKLDE